MLTMDFNNSRKRKLLPSVSRSNRSHGPLHCEPLASDDSPTIGTEVEHGGTVHQQSAGREPPSSSIAIECSHIDNEDLLLGLCPEDLMSTSFCISTDDCLIACEKLPLEAITPNIQSPDQTPPPPHHTSSSRTLHSTTKSGIHKQFTVAESVALPVAPSSIDREPVQSNLIFPSDTFYGLPLKVKKCIEENRGISSLYGECVQLV